FVKYELNKSALIFSLRSLFIFLASIIASLTLLAIKMEHGATNLEHSKNDPISHNDPKTIPLKPFFLA
ncbi:hypothetical protein D5S50_19120, partial [Salmonella enterica]|nr:hypothetical protein [Salmonella enterica]